jgi:hypothetical protein
MYVCRQYGPDGIVDRCDQSLYRHLEQTGLSAESAYRKPGQQDQPRHDHPRYDDC